MGKQLHIVMFPWFAMGHMIPFLHLANKLAERGHKTTFLLPRKALPQFTFLNLHQSLITLRPISVPHVDSLPPGTETASDIPIHLTTHLATAMDMTRPEVESIILSLKPQLDIIFYDLAHWVPEITSTMPRVISLCYKVVSAASLAIALVPARNMTRDKPLTESDLAKLPQGYPSKNVVLRGPEWRNLFFIGSEFGSGITFYERVMKALRACDAIAFRTCREIEGNFCDYMASQYNKPVLLSGPVLSEPDTFATAPLDLKWVQWLDQHDPGSVVFCAFGSQFVLEKEQLQELLLGFEMAGKPFLVAVKPPSGCASIDEALPEGFKEVVGDRGIVWGCWVQQPQILTHPSVGCFVNHCGFGSMWESLMSESQILLVPQLGDQILNARIMAEEMKVAVEVEREESGWVRKESLCKAIREIMDEKSQVGEMVRKNHARWREILGGQGFINGYIDSFVKDLEGLVPGKSSV